MGRTRATELTPRQREWLGHLRAAARSGETVRAYAKRHRLSEHAMYKAAMEARRREVQPAERRRSKEPPPSFVKVSPARPAAGAAAWRIRLANGVVLEGTGAVSRELLEALAGL